MHHCDVAMQHFTSILRRRLQTNHNNKVKASCNQLSAVLARMQSLRACVRWASCHLAFGPNTLEGIQFSLDLAGWLAAGWVAGWRRDLRKIRIWGIGALGAINLLHFGRVTFRIHFRKTRKPQFVWFSNFRTCP